VCERIKGLQWRGTSLIALSNRKRERTGEGERETERETDREENRERKKESVYERETEIERESLMMAGGRADVARTDRKKEVVRE